MKEGRPHVLLLTSGNTHDAMVAMLAIDAAPPSKVLATDKAYDSNALRSWLTKRGTAPVIPQRPTRTIRTGEDRGSTASATWPNACSAASRTNAGSPRASDANSAQKVIRLPIEREDESIAPWRT
ncbi:transposase [Croceicoccus sp. F390]|uniref:Transposase n=1 Tax=Croceicoccus esteveae TaxID=3075597 RepID=A0ABU2ZHG6_9SPHN|nr:transposase [Croceicoccus sp. F390]MDT0576035.1 transposase [Croceicoccus sp. F390]